MVESRDDYLRIMELGRREMSLLAEGETEELGKVLMEREEAIAYFISDAANRSDDAFLEKLQNLQGMNGRLQREARVLHQSLKNELLKLRSENKRLGGYRNGATIAPLGPSRVLSRKG